jgi:prephenate dehydrogenase
MSKDLTILRDEIDSLDRDIIKLLELRQKLVEEVAHYKLKHRLGLEHKDREQQVIDKLHGLLDDPWLQHEVKNIYSPIFKASKYRQNSIFVKALESFSKMKVGILGMGHFGDLLNTVFRTYLEDATVNYWDINEDLRNCELEELGKSDYLFICVPISSFRAALKQMSEFLDDHTVVVDICTVKVYPVMWMKEIFGENRAIIASHPMFGPQSTDNGKRFEGLNLMLHNVSSTDEMYDQLKQFWMRLGLNIVEITPEEHDRFAAYTINYNHLIGRVGERVGIEKTPIDTEGFKVIHNALHYVTNDTWQLFCDMQQYNPYAREMRMKVIEALQHIHTQLEELE